MPEGRYFKDALANFTSEAAYGGAVRHLYDMGYSAEQIREKLLYPASVQQIEKVSTSMKDGGIRRSRIMSMSRTRTNMAKGASAG